MVTIPTATQKPMILHGKYNTELVNTVAHAMALALPGATYARPVLDFGHVPHNFTWLHIALPRELHQVLDCNISTAQPILLRQATLAGARIRWVGPWPNDTARPTPPSHPLAELENLKEEMHHHFQQMEEKKPSAPSR